MKNLFTFTGEEIFCSFSIKLCKVYYILVLNVGGMAVKKKVFIR